MRTYPAVSIITVCRNACEGLQQTYRSLGSQTSRDFEWIVIDGASKDGTVEFLQTIPNLRLEWQSEPDHGIYFAMNRGLEKSKGTFVWFLNCGDRLFDEHTIETFVKQADSNDLIYSDVLVDGPDGTVAGKRSEITPHKLPPSLQKDLFKWGMIVSHQAFIVRRSLAPKYDCRYRLTSDLDWMLRILDTSIRSHQLECLARIAHPGASNELWYRSQWERFLILAKHFGLLATLFRHMRIATRRIRFGKKTRRWR